MMLWYLSLVLAMIGSSVNSQYIKKGLCRTYCTNGGSCFIENKCGHGHRRPTLRCRCVGQWSGKRCQISPCIDFDCNTGSCSVTTQGFPLCTCPIGCTGERCKNQDNSICVEAQGTCTVSQDCEPGNVLPESCCNGNVCCRTTQVCPVTEPGWSSNGNSCYIFSDSNPKTWGDAQTFCQSIGGRLAEVETVAENDYLKTQAQVIFGLKTSGLWIGGRDRDLNGEFTWDSTNGVISHNVLDWDTFQGFPAGQECLLIYLSGGNRKRDLPCTDLQGFICERPGA